MAFGSFYLAGETPWRNDNYQLTLWKKRTTTRASMDKEDEVNEEDK